MSAGGAAAGEIVLVRPYRGLQECFMSRRSKAREVVLQMLFQVDLNPDVSSSTIRTQMQERLEEADLVEFAWGLYAGVIEFKTLIDDKIQAIAPHWKLSRMAATDRNVLRLGAFELIQTDCPLRVVINEALELARKFGTDQSAQFVNGVLDKLVPAEKRPSSEPTLPAVTENDAAPSSE
jgi:transcription antitermination protein NusB